MIAAGIGSWFKNTLEIPWASSISDYKMLCPNNMLYWEAIRFAISKGFKTLDFGRSTPDQGTYYFKTCGHNPCNLLVPDGWRYRTLPDLELLSNPSGIVAWIWQRLPLTSDQVLGPMIVRNIP
jgi:hypothetical protein